MAKDRKILLISPSWIGGTVIAQALLKSIKKYNPQTSIEVLASKTLHPLLKRMPEVSCCIEHSFKHNKLSLLKRYRLGTNLRRKKYDQAIILPNSFKSSLIPFLANIPLRTGYCGEMRYCLLNDIRKIDKDKLQLLAERYLALGSDFNHKLSYDLMPRLKINKKTIQKTLSKFKISVTNKPILAICPGAEYGEAKRWPADYFAEVARVKIEQKWQIWIFGSAKDKQFAQQIQNETNRCCLDLTGKTDLGEAIDLLSLATKVITNDSGLMHIASALDIPLVAIFGSTTPKYTPPLSKSAKVISLNLPCSPCFKRECPHGHLKCLCNLKPKKILDIL